MALLLALSFPMLVHAPPSDTVPPVITTPIWQPSAPTANDQVKVSVNVTDNRGVNNVTLVYTTDNWKSVNTTLLATYNATTHLATAQIPAQANGGHVEFYIVAFDTSGNRAVNNNSGSYFTYDAQSPSLSTTAANWIIIAVILGGISTFAIMLVRSTMKSHRSGSPRMP